MPVPGPLEKTEKRVFVTFSLFRKTRFFIDGGRHAFFYKKYFIKINFHVMKKKVAGTPPTPKG
jgi:hypothetical protein